MSHPSHSDYSFISDDPEDWDALEWIIFNSPFGLGHVASRLILGDWMFDSYRRDPKTYLMMQAAETLAYSAVGYAIGGPTMTVGHARHVVVGQAITRLPLGAMPSVMLGFPILAMHVLPMWQRAQGPARLD